MTPKSRARLAVRAVAQRLQQGCVKSGICAGVWAPRDPVDLLISRAPQPAEVSSED